MPKISPTIVMGAPIIGINQAINPIIPNTNPVVALPFFVASPFICWSLINFYQKLINNILLNLSYYTPPHNTRCNSITKKGIPKS